MKLDQVSCYIQYCCRDQKALEGRMECRAKEENRLACGMQYAVWNLHCFRVTGGLKVPGVYKANMDTR